jgi:hypothetical protein
LVLEKRLAEGFTLQGISICVFVGDASESKGCDTYPQSLVGEGLK